MLEILSCSVFQKIIQANDISADDHEQGLMGEHTAYAEVAKGVIGHEVDWALSSACA